MTEEKAPIDADAEGAEAPVAPVAPPKPGMRPRPNRPPPPPPSKPSKLKGYLMLGILISTVVLIGMIGYKVYRILFKPPKREINVEAASKDAFKRAEDAQKEIFRAESKVWIMGETISAATAVAIGDQLEELRKCDDGMKELFDWMHLKKAESSSDWDTLVTYSLQTKLWILDASDLLDNLKKPGYGGLYIPMYSTMKRLADSQKELKEIQIRRDELAAQAETNPELKKKTREKIGELKKRFADFRDQLNGLDKYIHDGLAREDLSPKIIKELDELHTEAANAQMAIKLAGTLASTFGD